MKPIKKPPKEKETDELVVALMPDSDGKLRNITGVSLLVALALSFWATTYEVIIDDMMFEKTSSLEIETKIDIADKKEEKKQEKISLTLEYTDGLIEKGGISTDVFKKDLGAEKTENKKKY